MTISVGYSIHFWMTGLLMHNESESICQKAVIDYLGIFVFAWQAWGTAQKPRVRIASLHAKIWTMHLQSKKC